METRDLANIVLRQAGEIMALKALTAQLVQRLANESTDPEAYVLTLTETLHQTSDDAALDDQTPPQIAQGMADLADYLERMTLTG